jgi:pimeloyl-ACP methyl ester carboxylesterase
VNTQAWAPDQRGVGLSDKPESGYDTATGARDIIGLTDALGHDRFAIVGVDTGMPIAYAVAVDYPQRVDPDALRGSFGWYQAILTTASQNEERKARPLTMPVLGIGGEQSGGDGAGRTMKLVARDVETKVISDSGHWVGDEAPEELLHALTAFLAPYRDNPNAVNVAAEWPLAPRGTRGWTPAFP